MAQPCGCPTPRPHDLARWRPGSRNPWPLIGAEPAREHVGHLRAGGMAVRAICESAGVSPRVLQRLLYGMGGLPPSPRIRANNAAALLSTRLDPALLVQGRNVPALPSQRKVQALYALGWPTETQAAGSGLGHATVWELLHARRPGIAAVTARAVDELFARWSGTVGPSEMVRRRALREGWVPALAWDDIDDPGERPKGLVAS